MRLWAIWWGTTRGPGFIDYTTVRSTRREAWRALEKDIENSTPKWQAEYTRRRRNGQVKAVKVTLEKAT